MRQIFAFGLLIWKHDQIKMYLESDDFNDDAYIADP